MTTRQTSPPPSPGAIARPADLRPRSRTSFLYALSSLSFGLALYLSYQEDGFELGWLFVLPNFILAIGLWFHRSWIRWFGALVVSLYMLIAYAGLSVTLLFLQYTKVLDEKAGRAKEGLDVHVLFLLSILKMLLFTLAMVMFVVGLQALRHRAHPRHDED